MLVPDTVLQGRYRIVRQLGQGGMGTVFEAIDERLDTTVALKETLFTDERLRKQFEREARLLARLHHPALPRVSDHFSEGEGQFLVMQFIVGEDLSEMIARRQGPFPVSQVLSWADQLLDALDYLHTQDPQIIHRDIKPQNLKQTARGQIILLDFGLAKGQTSEVSRVATSASIFGYTPNYAPLEQVQGLGTDARSDIYSLSATLYHLVTGTKPPDALTRAAAIVNGQPDPLVSANELNNGVSPAVAGVLQRAMAQNREHRFTTAAEMRRALQTTGEGDTVSNRSEANTVLFAQPPSKTEATQANQVPRTLHGAGGQATIHTGETTVVRKEGISKAGSWPRWMIAAASVLMLAIVGLGFYALRNRDSSQTVTAPVTPGATPSPALANESPTQELTQTEPKDTTESASGAAVTKERPAAEKEKPKATKASPKIVVKTPIPGEVPEPDIDVDVPEPPGLGRRVSVQRHGGVTIRTFQDGSQMITTPDGNRFLVRPDGTRQVLPRVPPRVRRPRLRQ